MRKIIFTLLAAFLAIQLYSAPVIINGLLVEWSDASGDIVIPEEVTAIADNVFKDNQNITTVSGVNVVTIGQFAFYRSSLTSIDFPNVEEIKYNVFQYSYQLSLLNLPKLKTIRSYAFQSCNSLTSISLPSVEIIESSAFSECANLKQIHLPNINSIYSFTFSSCTSLEEIDLPNVTLLGGNAFENCTSLKEINIPNVSFLDANTFRNCTKLVTIELPKVKTVYSGSFYNCYLLESVSIPKIETILVAFQNCYSLKSVDCSTATNLETVSPNAFPKTLSDLTITVSDASKIAFFPPESERQYKVVATSGVFVNLLTSPAAGGTVSGGGAYSNNDLVNISATPAANYDFVNWTENGVEVSNSASYSFTITENRELTAHFIYAPKQAVSIIAPQNGSLQVYDGATELQNGDLIQLGKKIRVIPTPDEGYKLEYIEFDNAYEVSASFVREVATQNRAISSNEKAISIYPNPAQNNVVIQLNNHSNVQTLVVSNSEGKTIELVPVNQSRGTFNVSNYAKGVYYVQAGSDVQKLIVK